MGQNDDVATDVNETIDHLSYKTTLNQFLVGMREELLLSTNFLNFKYAKKLKNLFQFCCFE